MGHDWSGVEQLTTSRIAAFARPRAPTPESPPANRIYFPALDGLRGVAFLMVFATHYFQLPWGWGGVDVFFVLSGFLITGILYDSRGQPHRLRSFYVRRTLRIFPLYYGLMLLLLLSYPIFRWQWNLHWLVWPAYLGNFVRDLRAFAPGSPFQRMADAQLLSRVFPRVQLYFGHFWSLCVEEQFYLIWPWVVFWLPGRRKLLCVCLAWVAVCPLLRLLASHTLPQFMLDQEALYRSTPFRIDALLLGGAIALARRGPSPRRLLIAARIGFAALFSVLLLWLALDPAARHTPEGYVYPPWRFTWGLTFIDVLSACLIVMALESGSLTFRLFNLRPLRWLGRISYGAYVFHDILHVEWIRVALTFTGHWKIATAALGLASTLLLAWASFRWFETPFIRLKDRWTLVPAPAEPAPQQATLEPIRHVA